MWNSISVIKEIILWSLPFYFLHLYLVNIYNISLNQLIIWWLKNFTTTSSSPAIIISFLLLFLLFCLPFTSLMNSFYLNLFGEKQTLVYLGNHSLNNSTYYKEVDTNKTTFTGYNIEHKYNYSFKDLNKLKYFIKDPGTTNIVGQKNKRLHVTAFISTFFFVLFFLLPALGAIHALSYPMYLDLNGNQAYIHGEPIKAFELILSKFNISKGISVVILIGSLILALFFSGQLPDEENSHSIVPLPRHIKVGNTIQAEPVIINIRYDKRKNADDSTTTYDTGFRYVIFRFDQDFSPSVFVTLYFRNTVYPKLEKEIKLNISSKNKMTLRIDKNFELLPGVAISPVI